MTTIRFGFIGTNFITDWILVGALQDSRFELTAIYSRSQLTADAFAEKYKIKNTFTNLEEMAKSNLIDAVYISSPNSCHQDQSILFMDNKKHVLCEKPLAGNAQQARLMIETAKKNKVVLMEAMKPTLTPNFLTFREGLNKIGKIRKYISAYCQYSSRYDQFLKGQDVNAFKPDLCNGALMDIGIYTIYPMVVLFGKPESIRAVGIKLSTGVDAEGSVVFSYPNLDMDAAVIYSKVANSGVPTEVQGEEGTIQIDKINKIRDVKIIHRDQKIENLTNKESEYDDYYFEIKEFIDLIESGNQFESLINSWNNSVICLEIMDEIRKQIGVVYPTDEK